MCPKELVEVDNHVPDPLWDDISLELKKLKLFMNFLDAEGTFELSDWGLE